MKELIEGTHYYMNDEGNVVFTDKYHHDRGYCCGNGCKHCPFTFENVPEPYKTILLQKKENTTE